MQKKMKTYKLSHIATSCTIFLVVSDTTNLWLLDKRCLTREKRFSKHICKPFGKVEFVRPTTT